jgi:hypothetical protein
LLHNVKNVKRKRASNIPINPSRFSPSGVPIGIASFLEVYAPTR